MTAGSGLAGRVALVTGASGGIGQAIARRLAAEGALLALAYGTRAAQAEALAANIADGGGKAVAVRADLRGPRAPGELVRAVEEALGPVDLLVSNAGLGRRQSLEEISSDDFDEMLAVNLRAPAPVAGTGMLPGDPGQLREQVPAGRLGRPAEVADLAIAILGNAYLTSQVISLDGGMHPR
ncbi:MAG TPA: SDR family NAD(P)-dependent oxidoreductase [Trebonia sp.]|nr:SDR family NAD(P)-dependent oxidoreductase [Trebonia sp.]